MTINQFIAKLNRQLTNVVDSDKPLKRASLAIHQQSARRIFGKSLDANNSPITYVSPKGPRRGAYSEYWAEKREEKGRQTKRVDFTYTNNFKSDFMNAKTAQGAKPIEINPHEYRAEFRRNNVRKSNQELANIFEGRTENKFYNTDIFSLSNEEIKLFFEIAEKELIKAFQ